MIAKCYKEPKNSIVYFKAFISPMKLAIKTVPDVHRMKSKTFYIVTINLYLNAEVFTWIYCNSDLSALRAITQ